MSIVVWDQGPDSGCAQCKMTTRAFDKEGAVYETRDITAPENAEQLAAFKEQGHLQSPIVVTPTNTWSGFRPDEIKTAAAQQKASQQALQGPSATVGGPGMG